MKTMFSMDMFGRPGAIPSARMGQGPACVLVGTKTHPSDDETLYERTIEKYEALGWTIVREETGRIHYAGTADETIETNIWACPPGYGAAIELERSPFLPEVPIAMDGGSDVRPGVRKRRHTGIPPVLFQTSPTRLDPAVRFPTSPRPILMEGAQVPVRMGQVPGHPDLHWGMYNGQYVRWPDCDPRYDASCPFPTSVATEDPGLGQTGVVGGFGGGPGGFGSGFGGGPGGMVGPVQGSPSPASGPITGPSIPCGPAGYGPSCPPPNQAQTVMQVVYPIENMMGSGNRGSGAAHGRDVWPHPDQPCPPGYFHPSPGSPCVREGDLEDYGIPYGQNRP